MQARGAWPGCSLASSTEAGRALIDDNMKAALNVLMTSDSKPVSGSATMAMAKLKAIERKQGFDAGTEEGKELLKAKIVNGLNSKY